MNEEIDYLFTEDTEVREEEPAGLYADGICSRCMNTGYVIAQRGGLIGVVYNSTYEDADGKPVKRLVHCDCRISTDY